MTALAQLVEASQRVGATSSRRAKSGAIAQFLRGLAADEIALGVAYLAGATPQGRRGMRHALIRAAHPEAAASARTRSASAHTHSSPPLGMIRHSA